MNLFPNREHRQEGYLTDTVLECLTDKCRYCTGSYVNEILGIRLICKCSCHSAETSRR